MRLIMYSTFRRQHASVFVGCVAVLVAASMICPLFAGGATASESVRLPINLDFGTTNSPVNDVYDRVTPLTHFDGRYGWVRAVHFEERDRGGEDLLTRDFIFGHQPAKFRVAVPDGACIVTMTCCDTLAPHPPFIVRADGKTAYQVPEMPVGEVTTIELPATAKDGVIDIELYPLTDIWVVNGINIRARKPGEQFKGPRYTRSGKSKRLFESTIELPKIRHLDQVKRPDYDSASYPDLSDYMRVLERFPVFAERGWRANYKGLPDVGYFGDGDHGEMGLRTMGNFIFTCALLATDPAYDPKPTGVSQEKLLDYARQCLRYMTRAHVTGDLTCADGGKWGDHWQSAWWTGKMAAGAKLIWDDLTTSERSAVERVVVHEANRHLARQAPGGATSNTRSEENAWDTEVLAAALALFPKHENAAQWWRKLQDFSMNTLSAPQDKQDERLVDRRPVKNWVYTENIHSDFTIENHGAYHFCYMACPLHSMAWDWFNLTSSGHPVPQALFHHYTDVFEVVRRTFLYEQRFAYMSGKDWPRYAYGLSFILPALVCMQEVYGDRDARLFERARFRTLEREQIMNADGTFYGRRFTANRMLSRPVQYESDTYANLGACYLMHKVSRKPMLAPSEPGEFQRRVAGTMVSKESGWVMGRSPEVFTSFAWRDLGGPYPMGLFIPAGCDDMAEWGREQFTGSFSITGCDNRKREIVHNDQEFDGGFWTVGQVTHKNAEGAPLLRQQLAFVSLPEEGLALLMDHAVAARDIKVNAQEGLKFHLANDVFNLGMRQVLSPEAKFTLWGGENTHKTLPEAVARMVNQPWINVDGKLSFVALTSNAPFAVRDNRGRAAQWGSVEYDMISLPHITEPHDYHTDGLVRYSVVVLSAGDERLASGLSRNSKLASCGNPNVRCAVLSRNGKDVRLVAVNFGGEEESIRVDVDGRSISVTVPPMSAGVCDVK